jgi:hypothetical protein
VVVQAVALAEAHQKALTLGIEQECDLAWCEEGVASHVGIMRNMPQVQEMVSPASAPN